MGDHERTHAERLVGAVRALVSLDEAGRKAVEAGRADAEATTRRLSDTAERAEAQMDAGQDPTAAHAGLTFPQLTLYDRTVGIHESLRREARRETAFCDAYDALIALARVPELAEQVESVAASLRECRLLQVRYREAELEDLSPSQMPPSPEIGANLNAREHQRWVMQMGRRLAEWSRDRLERSRIWNDQAMAESGRLLQNALEAAERLLAATELL